MTAAGSDGQRPSQREERRLHWQLKATVARARGDHEAERVALDKLIVLEREGER